MPVKARSLRRDATAIYSTTLLILWQCLLLLTVADSQSTLQTVCTQLNGVVDGSRCYFVGNVTNQLTNWTGAWAVCNSYGAGLAQVHTIAEYNITNALARAYATRYALSPYSNVIALRDDITSSPPTSITNTTYWFDVDTGPNLSLLAIYTLARIMSADTNTYVAPRCFNVCGNDGACKNEYPICQYTSCSQNYSLTTVCVTETPIMISISSSIEECADMCNLQARWCRSFNAIAISNGCSFQCELFTWSVNDACPSCPSMTPANSTCFHYTYQP